MAGIVLFSLMCTSVLGSPMPYYREDQHGGIPDNLNTRAHVKGYEWSSDNPDVVRTFEFGTPTGQHNPSGHSYHREHRIHKQWLSTQPSNIQFNNSSGFNFHSVNPGSMQISHNINGLSEDISGHQTINNENFHRKWALLHPATSHVFESNPTRAVTGNNGYQQEHHYHREWTSVNPRTEQTIDYHNGDNEKLAGSIGHNIDLEQQISSMYSRLLQELQEQKMNNTDSEEGAEKFKGQHKYHREHQSHKVWSAVIPGNEGSMDFQSANSRNIEQSQIPDGYQSSHNVNFNMRRTFNSPGTIQVSKVLQKPLITDEFNGKHGFHKEQHYHREWTSVNPTAIKLNTENGETPTTKISDAQQVLSQETPTYPGTLEILESQTIEKPDTVKAESDFKGQTEQTEEIHNRKLTSFKHTAPIKLQNIINNDNQQPRDNSSADIIQMVEIQKERNPNAAMRIGTSGYHREHLYNREWSSVSSPDENPHKDDYHDHEQTLDNPGFDTIQTSELQEEEKTDSAVSTGISGYHREHDYHRKLPSVNSPDENPHLKSHDSQMNVLKSTNINNFTAEKYMETENDESKQVQEFTSTYQDRYLPPQKSLPNQKPTQSQTLHTAYEQTVQVQNVTMENPVLRKQRTGFNNIAQVQHQNSAYLPAAQIKKVRYANPQIIPHITMREPEEIHDQYSTHHQTVQVQNEPVKKTMLISQIPVHKPAQLRDLQSRYHENAQIQEASTLIPNSFQYSYAQKPANIIIQGATAEKPTEKHVTTLQQTGGHASYKQTESIVNQNKGLNLSTSIQHREIRILNPEVNSAEHSMNQKLTKVQSQPAELNPANILQMIVQQPRVTQLHHVTIEQPIQTLQQPKQTKGYQYSSQYSYSSAQPGPTNINGYEKNWNTGAQHYMRQTSYNQGIGIPAEAEDSYKNKAQQNIQQLSRQGGVMRQANKKVVQPVQNTPLDCDFEHYQHDQPQEHSDGQQYLEIENKQHRKKTDYLGQQMEGDIINLELSLEHDQQASNIQEQEILNTGQTQSKNDNLEEIQQVLDGFGQLTQLQNNILGQSNQYISEELRKQTQQQTDNLSQQTQQEAENLGKHQTRTENEDQQFQQFEEFQQQEPAGAQYFEQKPQPQTEDPGQQTISFNQETQSGIEQFKQDAQFLDNFGQTLHPSIEDTWQTFENLSQEPQQSTGRQIHPETVSEQFGQQTQPKIEHVGPETQNFELPDQQFKPETDDLGQLTQQEFEDVRHTQTGDKNIRQWNQQISGSIRQYFQTEIDSLSQVNHPNIEDTTEKLDQQTQPGNGTQVLDFDKQSQSTTEELSLQSEQTGQQIHRDLGKPSQVFEQSEVDQFGQETQDSHGIGQQSQLAFEKFNQQTHFDTENQTQKLDQLNHSQTGSLQHSIVSEQLGDQYHSEIDQFGQERQVFDDFGKQSQSATEDLGQLTQQAFEESGEQAQPEDCGEFHQKSQPETEKLDQINQKTPENFGQQSWQRNENVRQQTRLEIEDLGQQSHVFAHYSPEVHPGTENIDDQQTQYEDFDDFDQQTKPETRNIDELNHQNFGQQSWQRIENFGQQTQSEIEDLSQQSQEFAHFGQQTEPRTENIEQNEHKVNEQFGQQNVPEIETLGQQFQVFHKSGQAGESEPRQINLQTTETNVTAPPKVHWWNRLGNSITSAYDKAKQKTSNIVNKVKNKLS